MSDDKFNQPPIGGWGIIHPAGGVSCMCVLVKIKPIIKIKPMTKLGIAIRKYIRQYKANEDTTS